MKFLDDPEPKCTIEKNVRTRIAAKYPGQLKMNGLTAPEWGALKAFESKPMALRIRLAEEGRERFRKIRELKQRGFDEKTV